MEPGATSSAPKGAGPAVISSAVRFLPPGAELPTHSIQMGDDPGRVAVIGPTWDLVIVWDPKLDKLSGFLGTIQAGQREPHLPDFELTRCNFRWSMAHNVLAVNAPNPGLSCGPAVNAPASHSGHAAHAAPLSDACSGSASRKRRNEAIVVEDDPDPVLSRPGHVPFRGWPVPAGPIVHPKVNEEVLDMSKALSIQQGFMSPADRITRAWMFGCAYRAADCLDSVALPAGRYIGRLPKSTLHAWLFRATGTGQYSRTSSILLRHTQGTATPRMDATVIVTSWASQAECVAFLRGVGAATVDPAW